MSTETCVHHALEHADVFVPLGQAEQRRPAVLFIHGGGWGKGNRRQFVPHAQRFAEAGYVSASVSYRLTGEAQWPAQLDDVQQRLRELVARADEWQIDTARIAVVGSSAGGHLAACLGVRPGEGNPRPACIVDVHSVHDCTRRLLAESLSNLLGSRAEFPQRWDDASPIQFVDGETSPMLLTHDPDDPTVPFEQSVLMVTTLAAAGRPVEFLPTPGSRHGFFYNLNNPWAQRLMPIVANYIERQLCRTAERPTHATPDTPGR